MICLDVLFPEAARVLMLGGAELILVPNACDVEPWRMAVLQTRGIENMVGVALANYPGVDTEGHSCAYDPIAFRSLGNDEGIPVDPTVVRAGREAGIYVARFRLDDLRAFREAEGLGDAYRKPATYGQIVGGVVKPPFVRSDARR
jgi:predicted amidohydrolase